MAVFAEIGRQIRDCCESMSFEGMGSIESSLSNVKAAENFANIFKIRIRLKIKIFS